MANTLPRHRASWRADDPGYLTSQSSVRFVPVLNLKRPVLLQLLDYCISDQNFDAGDEGAVFKSRDCDAVNVPQIIRFYRPNMIAKATTQGEAEYCRK